MYETATTTTTTTTTTPTPTTTTTTTTTTMAYRRPTFVLLRELVDGQFPSF